MIVLQQAGLPLPSPPPPEKHPSLPMSVATRPTANLLVSPQKPLGLGSSLQLAQDEELATVVEQDPVLEELCKPLCCRLCNVTLNSAQQAQAHYQVRKEVQKETGKRFQDPKATGSSKGGTNIIVVVAVIRWRMISNFNLLFLF